MQTNEAVSSPQSTTTPPEVSIPLAQPLLTKKTPWLLISLTTLFFGITGILAYQNYQLKQQLADQEVDPITTPIVSPNPLAKTETPSLTPSPTSTPDPTVSWQTYTNAKYGITLKYPINWKYQEVLSKTQNTIDYLQIFLAKSEYFNPIPKGKPFILISIVETTDKNNLSIYQNTNIIKTVNINGVLAEERKHNVSTVDSKYIAFFKDGVAYEIESQMHTQDLEHQNIFDQIFSTFKFTD